MELHHLCRDVSALELHKLFLNQKLSFLFFLLSVECTLLSQLESYVFGVDDLLLLFSLKDGLLDACDNCGLVNLFKGDLGSIFSLFNKNIELSLDFILLLLQFHDLCVVSIDLLFNLKINLLLIVVEKSRVFLNHSIELGGFSCLDDIDFLLYLHAIDFSILLHVFSVISLQVFKQTSRTDLDISYLNCLQPDSPSFDNFEHFLTNLSAQCLSVSEHLINC